MTRVGGAAALLAAGTFGYGIAMFATTFADYTDPDATPTESVDFLVDHQGSLLAWYIGIFIVFGAALVPMGLALRQRLVGAAPLLANTGMVFAAIWAALMFATGMISNIGIEAVADLAESDPDRAVTVWSTIDTVTNGLGGGNELVGRHLDPARLDRRTAHRTTSSLAERHRHRHRRRRTDHRRPRLRSDRDGLRTRLDRLVHRHRRHPPARRRDRRGDVMTTALTQERSSRLAGTTAVRAAANLASSSGVERWAFGPATAVASALTAFVALRTRRQASA